MFLRFLLFVGCFGLGALAAGMVLYDIFLAYELDKVLRRGARPEDSTPPSGTPALVPKRTRRVIRIDSAAA